MQPVCQYCGQFVAFKQDFCGNCGNRLNTEGLDEPTERRNENRQPQLTPRSLAGLAFSDVSGTNISSQNFYPTVMDKQNYAMPPSITSALDTTTYPAFWTNTSEQSALLPVLPPQESAHLPVALVSGFVPVQNGPGPDVFAISQVKTRPLASSGQSKSKLSRRKALGVLGGLSVLVAAGLGTSVVISSQKKVGAAASIASTPRPQPRFKAIPAYTYRGHHTPVNGVIWEPVTPSGSNMFRVASCGSDVQVWNGLNGNNVTLYNTYQGEVFSVSWCHSTNKIVSGNLDGTAHIWLAATGQYVNRLIGHNGAIRGVAWAKDGVHIATASDDKQVGLWLLDTQHNDASSPIFLQKHNQRVYAVNFSDDSQYLVSGSSDRTAMIWHVKDSSYIATYSGHQDEVRTVAFAPGSLSSAGLLIASGSADQSVQVWTWDPVGKEFRLLTRYTGHHATINTLAWSSDGSRIASGDSAGQVHIWQSQTGAELLSFQPHQGEVSSLAWSPEGQYLASAGWDQVVHITRISMPMALPE